MNKTNVNQLFPMITSLFKSRICCRTFRRLCQRSFSSGSHQLLNDCEEVDDVVTTFGPDRRLHSGSKKDLFRAEDLVSSWRTLFYPTASCGSKSYALVGVLADLENALIEFVCDRLRSMNMFTQMEVSDILPLSTTKACGFGDPRNPEEAGHTLQYLVQNQDDRFPPEFCLSGTAEMGIAHQLRNRRFSYDELPTYYMARSRCFRPEISKSANEGGLYRVHEFNKVEMFAVCGKDQSEEVLSKIVNIQRGIFEELSIHCRIRDMPKEDLGVSAFRKFDIEAWMPGRQMWGEISSASSCSDYQARRLNLTHSADGRTEFVHTCNGTAIATSRTLIAVLETHQNPNGKRLNLPDCLNQYMPKKRSPSLRIQNAASFKYI